MVPFVERNYNMVELGPRGTGKSHLFQQVSPYAHLVSGGKATVAQMFVNNATRPARPRRQYDVVCFDEISGVSFDQKDGVNIMKGYMESGEFSRGKESIRADGGIVMVGNFDVDVEHQQRIGHLFGPLPHGDARRHRVHGPHPRLPPGLGRPEDEHRPLHRALRPRQRLPLRVLEPAARAQPGCTSGSRVSSYGGALSGRDTTAVNKTVDGLLKLLYPGPGHGRSADEDIEWAVRLALECRRRVKEQQKRIGAAEFRNTHFSYTLGEDGVEQFVATPELQSEDSIGTDPLPPARSGRISPGGQDENPGLYRIEVNVGPGLGREGPQQARAGAVPGEHQAAPSRTCSRARKELVGDRDPRQHEFTVQLRAFDAAKSGAALGVPALLALAGALLEKSLQGRADRRRRHQPRRRHRPGLQRRDDRRARGREGRGRRC